jgi:uncharacterized cupin superfamily protein
MHVFRTFYGEEHTVSKKISIEQARTVSGSRYPSPYNEPCMGRVRRCVGESAGLSQFGVNLTRLPPGAWSSQRHWHTDEDEFVFIVSGEVVLVSSSGEEVLRAGDCAGFKAGESDGHHLQNRSQQDAVFLEIGSRAPVQDEVHYPDIDLLIPRGSPGWCHRDGTPYPKPEK